MRKGGAAQLLWFYLFLQLTNWTWVRKPEKMPWKRTSAPRIWQRPGLTTLLFLLKLIPIERTISQFYRLLFRESSSYSQRAHGTLTTPARSLKKIMFLEFRTNRNKKPEINASRMAPNSRLDQDKLAHENKTLLLYPAKKLSKVLSPTQTRTNKGTILTRRTDEGLQKNRYILAPMHIEPLCRFSFWRRGSVLLAWGKNTYIIWRCI